MSDSMYVSRRDFLNKSLTLMGASATVPVFLRWTARAVAGGNRPSDGHRILVVVQLAGGNDGLNTIVPFRNELYYKLRPKLAVEASSVHRIDSELGFHPAAEGLKALFDDGRLAIVQGVGYPNANRSHFVSTDVWNTASIDGRVHEGWIGRYFDACCEGADPKLGVALVKEAPGALRGRHFSPVAFERPESLTLRAASDRRVAAAIDELNDPSEADLDGPTALAFLRRSTLDARIGANEIRRAVRSDASGVSFPDNALGRSLRTVSRMIAAKMPTRVYFVSLGGFDTHANQAGKHRRLLGDLGSSLQAFVKALDKQGDLDRTLVMTFSEFGRRVAENASGGTDHGEAAPMFLLGGSVRPGVYGRMARLDRLNRGDLPFAIDFRRVYATVLKNWLDADPRRILGGNFKPLPLL